MARRSALDWKSVLEYVEAERSGTVRLAELADRFGVTPFWLSRVFRRKTGTTYSRHMAVRRIERAKKLLDTTDLPVAEIAREAGYDSQAGFSRAFREVEGESPRKYRKRAGQVTKAGGILDALFPGKRPLYPGTDAPGEEGWRAGRGWVRRGNVWEATGTRTDSLVLDHPAPPGFLLTLDLTVRPRTQSYGTVDIGLGGPGRTTYVLTFGTHKNRLHVEIRRGERQVRFASVPGGSRARIAFACRDGELSVFVGDRLLTTYRDVFPLPPAGTQCFFVHPYFSRVEVREVRLFLLPSRRRNTLLSRGDDLVTEARYTEALDLYEQAAEAARGRPELGEALFKAAFCCHRGALRARASIFLDELRALAAGDPWSLQGSILEAEMLAERGHSDEAVTAIEGLARRTTDASQLADVGNGVRALASRYEVTPDSRAALRLLELFLRITDAPPSAVGWLRMRIRDLYLRLGDRAAFDEQGRRIRREYSSSDPVRAWSLYQEAHFLIAEGKPKEALAVVRDAAQGDLPASPAARFRMAEGDAHRSMGDLDTAVDAYLRAVRADPEDPSLVRQCAREAAHLLACTGHEARARKLLAKHPGVMPPTAESNPCHDEAVLEIILGNYREALARVEDGLRKAEEGVSLPDMLLLRGMLGAILGMERFAVEAFREAAILALRALNVPSASLAELLLDRRPPDTWESIVSSLSAEPPGMYATMGAYLLSLVFEKRGDVPRAREIMTAIPRLDALRRRRWPVILRDLRFSSGSRRPPAR